MKTSRLLAVRAALARVWFDYLEERTPALVALVAVALVAGGVAARYGASLACIAAGALLYLDALFTTRRIR